MWISCIIEEAIDIAEKYNIALCYLFSSQKEIGKAILEGKKVKMLDGAWLFVEDFSHPWIEPALF